MRETYDVVLHSLNKPGFTYTVEAISLSEIVSKNVNFQRGKYTHVTLHVLFYYTQQRRWIDRCPPPFTEFHEINKTAQLFEALLHGHMFQIMIVYQATCNLNTHIQ